MGALGMVLVWLLNIASVRATVGTGVQNAVDHVPPINLFVDFYLANNEVSR